MGDGQHDDEAAVAKAPSGGTFEALTDQECRELLQTTTVGRMAFNSAEGLQILVVNFVHRDDRIYLRTEPGTLLAATASTPEQVVFEVDHHHDLFQTGWSVVVRGVVTPVEDPDVVEHVRAVGRPTPWAAGDRSLLLQLTTDSVSGRRVGKH